MRESKLSSPIPMSLSSTSEILSHCMAQCSSRERWLSGVVSVKYHHFIVPLHQPHFTVLQKIAFQCRLAPKTSHYWKTLRNPSPTFLFCE